MDIPPKSTVPPVGFTMPMTALMNVLFPLPFGPTTPTIFPPSAISDISLTTGTGPYPATIPPMASRDPSLDDEVKLPADPLGEIGFNDPLVLSQL